jgi:hypothetical protein
MSVCVSSALNSGMTHVSHLHMTPALSMMNPFQNHQMAPSTIDMSTTSSSASQQQQMQSGNADPNEPNPEMLLALIARNKALEGEQREALLFVCVFFLVKSSMPSVKTEKERPALSKKNTECTVHEINVIGGCPNGVSQANTVNISHGNRIGRKISLH